MAEQKEKKVCPHCQKEISEKADKCPYCQSDLRSWFSRHPIATVCGYLLCLIIGGIILLVILGALFSGSSQSTQDFTVLTQPNNLLKIIGPVKGVQMSDSNNVEFKQLIYLQGKDSGLIIGNKITGFSYRYRNLIQTLNVGDTISVDDADVKQYKGKNRWPCGDEWLKEEPGGEFRNFCDHFNIPANTTLVENSYDSNFEVLNQTNNPLAVIQYTPSKITTKSSPTTNIQKPAEPKTIESKPIKYQKVSIADLGKYEGKNVQVTGQVNGVVLISKNSNKVNYISIRDGNYQTFVSVGGNQVDSTFENLNIDDTILVKGLYVSQGPPICSEEDLANYLKAYSLGVISKIENGMHENFCKLPKVSPTANAILTFVGGQITILNKTNNPSAIVKYSQPKIDYSQFQQVYVSDYTKNPAFYLNKKVTIVVGQVVDFLASSARGGPTNYILIFDAYNPLTLDWIALEVSDNNTYQKVVSSINKQDFIVAYGVGEESRSFTTSTGGSSLLPAIKVLRIDKCDLAVDSTCASGATVLFKTEY